MKAREMYNYCKRNESIYSDIVIKAKIAALGSCKRWSVQLQEGYGEILYNRVEGWYMNANFERIVRDRETREWITEAEFNERYQTTLNISQSTSTTDNVLPYFSSEQLSRINEVDARHNLREVHEYGFGDRIYTRIGILKDEDIITEDDSVTIGFEIETVQASGTQRNLEIYSENTDIRLGHLERDGSVNGVEFDSHIFTWNMLKKVKPLVKRMLGDFAAAGAITNQSAGLHIHINRNAFLNETSLQKFYFLVNHRDLRNFWYTIARRSDTSYCEYHHCADREAVIDSMIRYQTGHGVAVNQQHSNTIEIRIFESTLSVEILYGTIELLLKLVDFCNNPELTVFNPRHLMVDNIYISKMLSMIGRFEYVDVDLYSFIEHSHEELLEMLREALLSGNSVEADRLYPLCRQMASRGDR